MASASEIILEYVCPICGTIMAAIMFMAPVGDAYKASKSIGHLGTLNPTPWIFMLGNCTGWVTYSFVIQNVYVLLANVPGLLISIWLNMQAVKLLYAAERTEGLRNSMFKSLRSTELMANRKSLSIASPSQANPSTATDGMENEKEITSTTGRDIEDGQRETTNEALFNKEQAIVNNVTSSEAAPAFDILQEMSNLVRNVTTAAIDHPTPTSHENFVMFVCTSWVMIISIVAMGDKALTQNARELVVGLSVNLNLIFFYGAPLSTIYTVLRTRSSATIHIPTMTTNTVNGAFWCAYGLAVADAFIAVPNGLGALLGVVQMFLCVTFPRGKRTKEADLSGDDSNTNHQDKETRNDKKSAEVAGQE